MVKAEMFLGCSKQLRINYATSSTWPFWGWRKYENI